MNAGLNNVSTSNQNNALEIPNNQETTEQTEGKIPDSEDFFSNGNAKKRKSQGSITILCNSIIKDVKPYKIRNALTLKEIVYIKSFSGATIEDMHEYVKPSMKYNPNLVALHIGTNSIKKSPSENASEIIHLAMKLKTDDKVIISSILV